MNPRFQRQIASHNRHAVMAAILSLLGAWAGWTIAYGLFVGLILGGLTVANGQEVLSGERLFELPVWIHPAAMIAAFALLVWAATDERLRRFLPVDDRPVIGWHILGDILLLPARLTFGIGRQLSAVIRLNPSEQNDAVALLRHIWVEKRCPRHSLGAWFPNTLLLQKLLLALQMLGWIDLLRTEDDWIYILRSSESEEVAAILENDRGAGET